MAIAYTVLAIYTIALSYVTFYCVIQFNLLYYYKKKQRRQIEEIQTVQVQQENTTQNLKAVAIAHAG